MAPDETTPLNLVVRGEVSEDDVKLARALHRGGFFMWKIAAILIAILGTMALGDALRPDAEPDEFKMAWKFAAFAYGLLPFAFLYPRLWRPHEAPGHKVVRTITTDGVQLLDDGTDALLLWEQVVRSRASDVTAVLYMRGVPSTYVFPRRLFSSDGDWTSFRELLRAKTI